MMAMEMEMEMEMEPRGTPLKMETSVGDADGNHEGPPWSPPTPERKEGKRQAVVADYRAAG